LRFNAATAATPWRTRLLAGSVLQDWRFNAATAATPWRTTTAQVGPRGNSQQASMRPRRRRRGEHDQARKAEEQEHRFNAATAATPWRTRTTCWCTGKSTGFNAATAATPWRTSR